MNSEGIYIVQTIAEQKERADAIPIDVWFSQTRQWLETNHTQRSGFDTPISNLHVPYYGTNLVNFDEKSLIELSAHTKDKDYPQDVHAISITAQQGPFPHQQKEQFLIVEHAGRFHWYLRQGDHATWNEMRQDKVPVYALFALAKAVMEAPPRHE